MWRPFVVTGGVALAACGAFAIWASSPEQFGAAIGQRREVVLWDGSVVELNTNTEIEATPLGFLAGGPRRIRLARGEALFTVAHNGAAFDVATDGALVHATGTVFSVRRESDGVTVTVNEGSVEASLSAPRLGVALQAGQVLAARPQGISLHVLSDAELSRRQAWLQGRLAFDGESLAEVTEEVSRYTGAHFSFGDPDIGALPIVAYFKANDLDAFLGQLEANNATLRISRNGEDVRIERRR